MKSKTKEKKFIPYSQKIKVEADSPIVQHYDFKKNEKGELIVVPTTKDDMDKVVMSHIGEVGIYNIIKMLIARGIDPHSPEAGLGFTEKDVVPYMPPVETLDDVKKLRAEAIKTLAEVSKKFGLTPDELTKAVESNTLKKVVSDKQNKKEITNVESDSK